MTDVDLANEVNEILRNPELVKEIIQSSFTCDSPSDEMRMTLGSIEYLTEQRRREILEVVQEEIESAINRGTLHRFSGFLDYEPRKI